MTAEKGAEVETPRDAAEKTPWESELASFLTDLSKVQGETLQVLTRKRQCLVGIDTEGLTALAAQEQQVIFSAAPNCSKRPNRKAFQATALNR